VSKTLQENQMIFVTINQQSQRSNEGKGGGFFPFFPSLIPDVDDVR
jgi:hypothetical protein